MFGYVIADMGRLDETQRLRYQSCYCGLCHTLHRDFSLVSRLSLNYDLTFLVLLLSSLYEPEEESDPARCIIHPLKKQPCFINVWTRYGAAMSVVLTFYKCRDDWNDDKNPVRLAESQLFRIPCRRAAEKWPRQSGAVETGLAELSRMESERERNPDRPANCFARLMGELFVPNDGDRWSPDLRTVGEGLGRFIYLADAAADLGQDLRRGRYNPLAALWPDGRVPPRFRQDLAVLLGEAAAAFERLPLVQDAALLRNILYSGVWCRFDQAMGRQKEGEFP